MNSEQEQVNSAQESVNGEQNRKGKQRLFLALGLLFIITVSASFTFSPVKLPEGEVRVEIPAGVGSRNIGELLSARGVIRSKWLFVIYTALMGAADRLKPGFYTFEGRTSIPAVARTLERGGFDANEVAITIPEGWDLKDIGAYLAHEGIFPTETFWLVTGRPAAARNDASLPDFSNEFSFLSKRPPGAGLEGFLYPDTYRIFRNAGPEAMVRRMLENFDRKLDSKLRAEITRQGKTIFEIVTVASLLEKEVPEDEDRRIVAGILWKRLRTGIPLQVDASVNYATGKQETPSAADLAVNSPYNTYRFPGLPEGPIANPSIGAMRAAIFPAASKHLYYLSTPDGRTIFSDTLEEHARAKAAHLKQ